MWAFTEPQTGSDPKQIQTTARRDASGDWVLSGQKLFISFARQAIVVLVFATIDDPEVTNASIGAFLVEPSTQASRTGEPFTVLGYRGGEAAPSTSTMSWSPPKRSSAPLARGSR